MFTRFLLWIVLGGSLLVGMQAQAQSQFTICQGDSVQLSATAADLYEWLPHDGLNNPFIRNPKASPNSTTVYRVRRLRTSNDLLKNGNFEAGNTLFQTEYKDSIRIEKEGYLAITTNPSLNHFAMNACVDHTSGTGKFMVVNGDPQANKVAWSQTLQVNPNTDYAFSAFVNPGISSGDNQAILQFSINGQLLRTPYQAKYNGCGWEQFYATWNSGNASQAIISVVNQSLERRGNDFGLDDLFFQSFTVLTDSTTVTIKPADPAPTLAVSGDDTPCQGDSAILTGPAGAQAYIWNDGNTQQRRAITTSGVYVLRTKGANGCVSFPSLPKVVEVQALPNAPVATVMAGFASSICPDDSTILDASESFDYKWSNGSVLKNLKVNTAGTYTVQAINEQGCLSIPSNGITVSVRPRISTPRVTLSGDSSFCAGGSVDIRSSFGTNNFWSTGATSQTITASEPGQYWVFAKSGTSCASKKRFINIAIGGQATVPVITPRTSPLLCTGQTVVLESNYPSKNRWSTGDTTKTITVSRPGTYTLTATSTCGTATSVPFEVRAVQIPAAPVISAAADRTLCLGESIVLTSSATANNIWSTGDTSRSITVFRSGSFSVYQQVGNCSTTTSTPVAITVTTKLPTPTLTATGPTAFCSGNTVLLVSDYATNNVWSNGAKAPFITVTTPGRYFVQLENDACLSDTSNNISVDVVAAPNAPTIDFSKLTACAGQTVTLSTVADGRLIWSTGETTSSIQIRFVGASPIVVRAMGPSGCLSPASATANVLIDAIPAVPSITPASSQTICANGQVTLQSSSRLRTIWSRGDTAGSIIVRAAGSFSAKALSPAGCTSAASDTVKVFVEQAPAQPVVATVGRDSLRSSVVGTRYIWRRDGQVLPEVGQKIKVSLNGNYTVTVLSARDCTSPESAPVQVILANLASHSDFTQLSLSPNPAQESLTVVVPNGLTMLEIVDATGRTVVAEKLTQAGKATLSLKNLPAGVYTLRGLSAAGQVVGRFVKE